VHYNQQLEEPSRDDYYNPYYDDEDDNDEYTSYQSAQEDEASTTSSHFFSKKSLTDSTLYQSKKKKKNKVSQREEGTMNSITSIFMELCEAANISRPSRIQALAWPELLQGQTAIIADQTGSGKTLSYLLPSLCRMLLSRAEEKNIKKKQSTSRPKVLILAPTAELADQIKVVCDRLSSASTSSTTTFTSKVLTATGKYATNIRDQIRMLENHTPNIDVLISTPGRIATILRLKNTPLDLSYLQSIVFDEVDTLFLEETFGPQLRTVGAAAVSASTSAPNTQFIFVTATLPNTILSRIKSEFPNVVPIKGPGLHRVVPTVDEHLIDVSVPPRLYGNTQACDDIKNKEVLKALRSFKCQKTLVFCNTVESCRRVENSIRRSDRQGRLGVQVGSYHNAMSEETRKENLELFCRGNTVLGKQKHMQRKKHDNTATSQSILVCTDRAARGVDFDKTPIEHVILYDFPKEPAEYIRRVGRTARAGRKGRCTVLAYGWQLPIARSVMNKKMERLEYAGDDNQYSLDDLDDVKEFTMKQRMSSRAHDKNSFVKKKVESGKWK